MFLGHLAVGFASKRAAPHAPLGVLMAAPMLSDLLWPVFLLLGWEKVEIAPGDTAFTPLRFVSYPYSHSLLATLGWAALFAGVYGWRRRDAKAAGVIGIGVVSHWLLDLVTHRPDLPLFPGNSPHYGWGLWNFVSATIVVESLMFGAATWIYCSTTRSRNRAGAWGFWSFVIFVTVAYVANITGPPPPSVTALAWVALSMWIFPFWVNWFDLRRSAGTNSGL